MDHTIVSAFAAALSRPEAVITDTATLTESGKDYWGFGNEPELLLRPGTRDEVVAIVNVAAAKKVSLVSTSSSAPPSPSGSSPADWPTKG